MGAVAVWGVCGGQEELYKAARDRIKRTEEVLARKRKVRIGWTSGRSGGTDLIIRW
jgi:hypothetical protein